MRKASHYHPAREPAGTRVPESALSELGLSDESIDLLHTFGYAVYELRQAVGANDDVAIELRYFVRLNGEPASVGLSVRELQEFFELLGG